MSPTRMGRAETRLVHRPKTLKSGEPVRYNDAWESQMGGGTG